jgi:hypothetical protein
MNELQIGWGSRDVSTDKPITIPGQFHTRVSHVTRTVHLDKRRVTEEEAAYEKKQLDELLKVPFKKDGTPQERLIYDSTLVPPRITAFAPIPECESQTTRQHTSFSPQPPGADNRSW